MVHFLLIGVSVQSIVVLHVGELVKFFLLEKHAYFRSLRRSLLSEHLVDIS